MAQPQATPHTPVRLRPAGSHDAESMLAWRKEPSVRRFQPLTDLSLDQLRAEVAGQRINDLYRGRGDKFQWIVLDGHAPAGWITLVVNNWDHGLAEVGYALSTAFQGRGVMTRAMGLLLKDLFTNTRLERLEARCATGNGASQRVLEKLGFEREGRLRGYFRLGNRRVDNYLYSYLRRDLMRRNLR